MSKRDVINALEKAIVKASKDKSDGKQVSEEGLARLVSSYCRLKGIGRYGAPKVKRDPFEYGDPDKWDFDQ